MKHWLSAGPTTVKSRNVKAVPPRNTKPSVHHVVVCRQTTFDGMQVDLDAFFDAYASVVHERWHAAYLP